MLFSGRGFRLCVPVLLLPWAGCGSDPTPSGPTGEPVAFQHPGATGVLAVISPESYLFAGCEYLPAQELSGRLLTEARIADAPEPARRDLGRVLAEVERLRGSAPGAGGRADPAGPEAAEQPLRVYELVVRARWILDLELSDDSSGEVGARALPDGREVRTRVPAPDLLAHLRQVSFQALREAMTRPRRARPWNFVALADYLRLDVRSRGSFLEEEDRDALRREILAALGSLPERERLAVALIPRVRLFSRTELEPLEAEENIALRVLALTHKAIEGERKALDEILTLSLEYFARARVFAAALGEILPVAVNADLYRRYPDFRTSEVQSLGLIQEVRGRFAQASHEEGVGWVLGEESESGA